MLNTMKPMKDLLLDNYALLQGWHLSGMQMEQPMIEVEPVCPGFDMSDCIPAMESGAVYHLSGQRCLNSALWHLWAIANDDPGKRVLIIASDISATVVSMHLFALLSNCEISDLKNGNGVENWPKLAVAANRLADTGIEIIERPALSDSNSTTIPRPEGVLLVLNAGISTEQMENIALKCRVPVISVSGIVEVTWSKAVSGKPVSLSLLGVPENTHDSTVC